MIVTINSEFWFEYSLQLKEKKNQSLFQNIAQLMAFKTKMNFLSRLNALFKEQHATDLHNLHYSLDYLAGT